MEYWDLEDYLEEIKFLMTEYDDINDKDIILDWEAKARDWAYTHNDGKKVKVKSKDDIQVAVKDENIMWDMALKYNNYYRKNKQREYWKEFDLTKAY